jgi:SAM-dependent methyltransferase
MQGETGSASDPYRDLADRYDWMISRDEQRERFLEGALREAGAKEILDCACGTGHDLVLLRKLGFQVHGSDLSAAMLDRAALQLRRNGLAVPLKRADFRALHEAFPRTFDAVLCLTNSINELLDDEDALRALRSMHSVLRSKGVLILDQGQTDKSMRNPPTWAPVVNERDFSRLFTMTYERDVMTVRIFDFVHTDAERSFHASQVRIKIRLRDFWERAARGAGFESIRFCGSWRGEPYSRTESDRLILVARKA